jgi:lipopolysaccharide assembly outer membrane protein LptD (OstA)
MLSVISLSGFAQESKRVIIEGNQKESFMCQHAVLHEKDSTITLTENVRITTDRLYLEADSVILDMKDKSFVAYRYKEFKFRGEAVLTEKSPKHIVRYKLKSETIFVD